MHANSDLGRVSGLAQYLTLEIIIRDYSFCPSRKCMRLILVVRVAYLSYIRAKTSQARSAVPIRIQIRSVRQNVCQWRILASRNT